MAAAGTNWNGQYHHQYHQYHQEQFYSNYNSIGSYHAVNTPSPPYGPVVTPSASSVPSPAPRYGNGVAYPAAPFHSAPVKDVDNASAASSPASISSPSSYEGDSPTTGAAPLVGGYNFSRFDTPCADQYGNVHSPSRLKSTQMSVHADQTPTYDLQPASVNCQPPQHPATYCMKTNHSNYFPWMQAYTGTFSLINSVST